jgi:hypothetical protein
VDFVRKMICKRNVVSMGSHGFHSSNIQLRIIVFQNLKGRKKNYYVATSMKLENSILAKGEHSVVEKKTQYKLYPVNRTTLTWGHFRLACPKDVIFFLRFHCPSTGFRPLVLPFLSTNILMKRIK